MKNHIILYYIHTTLYIQGCIYCIYSCKLSYKIYILNHYRFQSINNFVFDEKKKVVSVSFIWKVYFRFQNRSFRIQNRPHRRFWLWHWCTITSGKSQASSLSIQSLYFWPDYDRFTTTTLVLITQNGQNNQKYLVYILQNGKNHQK